MPRLPESALKEVVNALPEEWVMKARSIPNYLAKRKVKTEELEFSGVSDLMAKKGTERVTKSELSQLAGRRRAEVVSKIESAPKDEWIGKVDTNGLNSSSGDVIADSSYESTLLKGTKGDLYTESVYEFKPKARSELVKSPSHYPEDAPNYLMHSRATDTIVGDKDTVLVQELQSDLFQQVRKLGKSPRERAANLKQASVELGEVSMEVERLKKATLGAKDRAAGGVDFTTNGEALTAAMEKKKELTTLVAVGQKAALLTAPFEKRWLNKLIDYEVFAAGDRGKEALAIPLEGAADDLVRGSGVQKWYETTVRSTLKKKAISLNNQVKEQARKAGEPVPTGDSLFSYKEVASTTNKLDGMTIGELLRLLTVPKDPGAERYITRTEEVALRDKLIGLASGNSQPMAAQLKVLRKFVKQVVPESELITKLKTGQLVFPTNTNADKLKGINYRLGDVRLALTKTTSGTPEYNVLTTQENALMGELGNVKLSATKPAWLDNIKLYANAGVAVTAGASAVQSSDSEAGVVSTIAKHTISAESKNFTSPNKSQYNLTINKALDSGYNPDELSKYLIDKQGMTKPQASAAIGEVLRERVGTALRDKLGTPNELVQKMLANGYSEDMVKQAMPDNSILETYWKGAGKVALDVFAANMEAKTVEQLAVRSKAIHKRYGTDFKRLQAFMGDQEMQMEVHKDLADYDANVIETLKGFKVEARRTKVGDEAYELEYMNKEGQWQKLETSMVQEILAERGEFAAGVLGGTAGFRAAANAMPGNPLVKGVAGIVGGAIGSSTAVMGGGAIDLIRNSIDTREELTAMLAVNKLKDIGAANAIIGVAGSSIFKLAGFAANKTYRLLDYAIGGRVEAASEEAMKLMNLDRDQALELVADLQRVLDKPMTGRDASKIIQTLARTHPRSAEISSTALSDSAEASANIARELDLRAKSIIDTAESGSSDMIGKVIRGDLAEYRTKVKDTYGAVKQLGVLNLEDTAYKFDYSTLAIDPIIERRATELLDTTLRDQMLNFLQRAREIGGKRTTSLDLQRASEQVEVIRPMRRGGPKVEYKTVHSTKLVDGEEVVEPTLRSFEDLLDLHKLVNEFGRSKNISKKNAKDIQLISEIRGRVKAEIAAAAKQMPEGADWLKAWKIANKEYSKMFKLEKNVLAKAIVKDESVLSNDAVVKQLMRSAQSFDGSGFRALLESVPAKHVPVIENTVVNGFIKKFTKGSTEQAQAIDFPGLAEQLNSIKLVSADARQLKRVVDEFAKVFKADKQLMAATKAMKQKGAGGNFATTIQGKAHMELIGTIFKYFKRLSPFEAGRQAALAIQLGKALRTPTNATAVNKLVAMLPKDPIMRNQLKAQFLNLAKFGQKSDYPEVTVYNAAAKGHTKTKVPGDLGDGIYYTTGKGSGKKEKIDPELFVDEEYLKAMLGLDEVTKETIKSVPGLQERLVNRGMQGIVIGSDIVKF